MYSRGIGRLGNERGEQSRGHLKKMDSAQHSPDAETHRAGETRFEARLVLLRRLILFTMVWFSFYILASDVAFGVYGIGPFAFRVVLDIVSLSAVAIVITLFVRGLWQIPRLSVPIMAGMFLAVAGQCLLVMRGVEPVRAFMDFFPSAPQTYLVIARVLSGFGIILYLAGMLLVVVELLIERQRAAHERRRLANEVEERRRIEHELKIKDRFQQAIQDTTVDPIRVLDADGRPIWCNEAAVAWFGALAVTPDSARRGQSGAETVDLCRSVFADGFHREFETTARLRDGTEREVFVRLNPMRDGDGRVHGVLEVCHDMTERIRSQEALMENEARMRAHYMSIPVPTYTWQKRGEDFFLVNYNHAALRATKGRIAEWLGINAHEFFKDRPDVVAHLEQCYNQREVLVRETPFRMRSTDEVRQLVIRYVYVPPDSVMAHTEDVTDVRRTEQDLLASERELDSIIRTIPDIVFRLDAVGRITFISEAVRRYGYEPDDMLGRDLLEYVHPGDRERAQAVLHERRTDFRAGPAIELRLLPGAGPRPVAGDGEEPPDGHVFLVDASGRYETVGESGNRFLGTQGIARDISDRKVTERALRESEERFRTLVENSREVIMLTRRDAVVEYLSPAARTVLGWEPSELENTVPDIVYPEDKQRVLDMLRQAMGGSAESNTEYRIVTRDGRVKWISHSWSPIHKKGELALVVSVIADITDRKRAEEERSRLVTAIEQAAEAVVITDAGGVIQYVNPAFEHITGYTRLEATGQTPRILCSGKHDASFYKEMWETIAGGRVWQGRIMNKRKDGVLYEEDMTISPVRNDSGAIVNYVALKRDITKEVSLERQLYQAQKMEALGTLARGIAHDMNNILSLILGHSEVAEDHVSEDNPAAANIAGIRRAATRASDLVTQILTFSRSEEPRREPVNLAAVADDALNLVRASFPPMIELQVRLPQEDAFVLSDPTRMHQVLMNLCANALQAINGLPGHVVVALDIVRFTEPAALDVGLLDPGEYACLEVTDSGQGMDKATRQRIFDPFFTTKRAGEGTGLGLPTVLGIVTAAGGGIAVESEPGQGATFRVYLPRIAAPPPSDATRQEPAVEGHERVLLVDDNVEVANITAGVLESLGYSVQVLTDPIEAWNLFQAQPGLFNIVVTDNIMRNIDGVQLAVRMRALRHDLPVILVTGYSQNLQVDSIRALGINEVLLKPLHRDVLSRAVRRALDRPETLE